MQKSKVIDKKLKGKNQKALSKKPRLFDMDPARLAPASLRVDGRILLHETTDPDPPSLYQKRKRLANKYESFSLTRRFSP